MNDIWTFELDIDNDLYNLIDNPYKQDEVDSDFMLNVPTSNYFTVPKFNAFLERATKISLSMINSKVRSLPKNLTLLNDLLCTVNTKPNIIALTETRLNSSSISNVDILGYKLFHVDSDTAAGGVGISWQIYLLGK